MKPRLLVAIVLLAMPLAAQQPSPRELFERARILDESNRTLDDAVALYARVSSQSTDRELAAMALLRAGLIQERLGRGAEAQRSFRNLIERYGADTPAGRQAASKLQEKSPGPPRTAGTLALRRVYEGPGLDWCNGLSSDLQYLSHPDWRTGNIAVADLRNGSVRNVTTGGSIGPVTAQVGEFGECTVFSPDNRSIAYYWRNAERATELRSIGIDGAGMRVLYRGDVRYLQPIEWSPDGRQILALLYSGAESRQIALIPASGGAARVVKELPDGGVSARFSPDGRYIAYSARQSPTVTATDLFVMNIDGAAEQAVTRHAADDQLLGWADDGRTLFFASNRTGTYGVWRIAVDAGQPQGNPALVKADVGPIVPIRFVNGTLLYAATSRVNNVFLAPIDLESDAPAAGPAVAVRADFAGAVARPAWSPDGRALAYVSFRGTAGYPSSPDRISILDLSTRAERHLQTSLEMLDPYGSGPQWSPDGRTLLVIARQQTPQHGIYRVDAETGAVRPVLVVGAATYVLQAVWSRDGRSVFYLIGDPTRIVRRDLETNADVELVTLPNPAGVPKIALSPDGQLLAFTARVPGTAPAAVLNVVVASGGPVREIYRAAANETTSFVAWTPDGRYILFMKGVPGATPDAPRRPELWRATPDGTRRHRVEVDLTGIDGGTAISPDGRRLALVLGESKSELWALDLSAGTGGRP